MSAGELQSNAADLEWQLTQIFQTASKWKALLLLDEADVLLQRRDGLTLERNRLVAVFLRKLEYFDGIMFLTTNTLSQFDDAVLDRIHLKMHYELLDKGMRKTIITRFLERTRGGQNIDKNFLDRFAGIQLNGREVSYIRERRRLWLITSVDQEHHRYRR